MGPDADKVPNLDRDMRLTRREIAALMGAHSIGKMEPPPFSGFKGSWVPRNPEGRGGLQTAERPI